VTAERFAPLLDAPVLRWMALLALAIVLVYVVATAVTRRGATPRWSPLVLRVLAVLGLVVPGWAIFGWYRDLARARELTRSIPVEIGPIADRFVINSAALLSLGFLLLVIGIYLARRVGRSRTP
jgi:hypothetical protein